MHAANDVPAAGVGAEVVGGRLRPLGLDRRQPAQISLGKRIVQRYEIGEARSKSGAGALAGEPIEGERALAESIEQTRVGQQLEVSRDARLALPEDLRDLADRKLGVSAQREDSQSRGLRNRLQPIEEPVHRDLPCRPFHATTVAQSSLA